MTRREFEWIRTLAREKFGLDLRTGKEELVSARLGRILREGRFRSFDDYFRHVTEDETEQSLIALINALTTNFTSFDREPAHFDFLRHSVIPALGHRERIEVWSAACASGEEPYSIAFCLLDELGLEAAARIRILASDISTKALETARIGMYPAERFAGLARERLRRYLLRGAGRWQGWYKVKPDVQRLVEFRRINLVEPNLAAGVFPVVFCRNVLIYFDKRTQEQVVNRLVRHLEPGGYLFVGHAESLSGIRHGFEYIRPATYRTLATSGAGERE